MRLTTLLHRHQKFTQSIDPSILEAPEIEVPRQLKRRRVSADDDGLAKIQHPVEMRVAKVLPLQHEVLHQQLAVFSAQLQLIEEQ